MKSEKKIGIHEKFGIWVLALVVVTTFFLCQKNARGEGRQTGSVTGAVQAIDWVGSEITLDSPDGESEITFKVAPDAIITRATDKISLADIEIQDNVRIDYYFDPDTGNRIAARIDDSSLGNE